MQKLTIGYSPCPNDTFIFDALVHEKIDTEGLQFEVVLKDVEELNHRAFEQDLDITKLSYHAMAHLLKSYQLLNSGSALGSGVGPLLIAKQHLSEAEIDAARIAIPGKYTTANFLLSLAYPRAQDKVEVLFSEVEEAVLSDDVDAGLIIHENRFTYEEKGLVKLIDLGNYWEEVSGNLIPLGGIVVRRKFDQALKEKIDRVLKRSIAFAFENRESSKEYVKAHAQEMDEKVMQQHIDLYVNQYSLDLGETGRKAVKHLFQMAVEKGLISQIDEDIFV
jgi:1,4-dihydroxy-6-naphthoate synthase